MGEPQDLTPDEAVERSSDIYRDLEGTEENKRIMQEYKRRLYFENEYIRAGELLHGPSLHQFADRPDGVTSDDINNARRVLYAYREMFGQKRSEIEKQVFEHEPSRKAAVGEAHELYQDRDNREAIQDAAVQGIGPENTSFGKSQLPKSTPDTQAE